MQFIKNYGVLALCCIAVLGSLGYILTSREMVFDQAALIEADSRLIDREAAIIREVFFLDEGRKANFADLTRAQKELRQAVDDVINQTVDDRLASEMQAALIQEFDAIEAYKSNWAVSRYSSRSVARLTTRVMPLVEAEGAFDVYAALVAIRSAVANEVGSLTPSEKEALVPAVQTVNAFVAEKGSDTLVRRWREIQTHIDAFVTAKQNQFEALQSVSGSALLDLAAQAKAQSSAQVERAHSNELRNSNIAFGASALFLTVIVGLVFRLNGELRHRRTENDRLEAAVKERTSALEDAIAETERLAEAKSSFLANMSHEIRTPMNGVLGMAELLSEMPLEREQRSFVDSIKGSAEALLTIINDILDFSKADSGKLQLQDAPFRLDDVVEDLVQLLAVTARSKNVELIVDYPVAENNCFIGDSGRMRQVLLNIAGNAVKFTPEGYVAISVRCEDVDGVGNLTMEVRDTGIGMSQDVLSKIFESFVQADNSSERVFEGTGLGLAISRKLIEAMGGDIDVTSEVGVGSVFTIKVGLPITEEIASQPEASADIGALAPMNLLVVDDVELNRRIITDRFLRLGHSVTGAVSGEAALQVLSEAAAQNKAFDLAFLDYQMPGMNGLTLSHAIRDQIKNDKLPIIMLSSVTGIEEYDDYKSLNNIQALTKPAKTDLLMAAVCKAVGAVDAPLEAKAETLAPDELPDFFGAGVKLLVAEDTVTNQILIRKIAEKVGFEISIANNGAEAVEKFKAWKPDIIVMDWAMPMMSGLEATQKIRQIESEFSLTQAPIIGLSANAMREHAAKGLAAGMTQYLSKPVKKADLLRALFDCMQNEDDARTRDVSFA